MNGVISYKAQGLYNDEDILDIYIQIFSDYFPAETTSYYSICLYIKEVKERSWRFLRLNWSWFWFPIHLSI